MNTRFSENEIRFRINRSEMESLLSGHRIHLQLDLPDQEGYQFRIHPLTDPVENDRPLSLTVRERLIELGVGVEELKSLSRRLPSKEGLTTELPSRSGKQLLRVALEIDLKDRS